MLRGISFLVLGLGLLWDIFETNPEYYDDIGRDRNEYQTRNEALIEPQVVGANRVFYIYPNPVEDILYLSVSRYVSSMQFSIFDAAARTMYSTTIKFITTDLPVRIPVSQFPPGIYSVRMIYNGNTETATFIKR